VTDEGEERLGHHLVLKQMIMLMDLLNIIASAAGQALRYSAHHHWFFGFVLFCYTFRLHDRSVHARSARWTSESTRSGSVSPAISDAMRAYGLSISIDLLL
jgi:hypothetical protein